MNSKRKAPFTTLEKEALICGRCGYCRNSCPAYRVIGWESAAPRGKIHLAKRQLKKKQKLTDELAQRVAQCTLCGACADVCPARIDTRELWLELRKRIARAGKAPKGHVAIRDNLLANRNITKFPNSSRLEWTEGLEDADLDAEGLELKPGSEVCYFVGCVSSFFPRAAQVSLAMAEILMRSGVDFTMMGGEEWCCGFPLTAAGFVEDGRQFIQHNVSKIKELGVHTLVATCPSCYQVWKEGSREELAGYDLDVLHAAAFLEKLVAGGRIEMKEMPAVITYHDPCDLGRNSGIYEPPRRIIKSIPGVKFVEMKHNREHSLCCGGGGNLQSVDGESAAAISRLRAEEIRETGANIVVSTCQQCEQMLSVAVSEAKLPVRVMDLSELLLEAMG